MINRLQWRLCELLQTEASFLFRVCIVVEGHTLIAVAMQSMTIEKNERFEDLLLYYCKFSNTISLAPTSCWNSTVAAYKASCCLPVRLNPKNLPNYLQPDQDYMVLNNFNRSEHLKNIHVKDYVR